jgi:cellulose synthase/poly-beta-1,6-N-acetylglucosamine synthase-like glycosyltransferase
MVYILFLLIGILAFFASLLPISLFILLYVTNKTEPEPRTEYHVAVIVPCKGLAKNLENNLQALCDQEYPNYQIIFVLDSSQDPAFPLVNTLVNSSKNARIEYAEPLPEASGKIAALISGIYAAGPVDVYVFADSDIRPHVHWLAHLVAGLSKEKVGATTGFRWFFPDNLTTALISVWNMTSMATLFHPLTNCTWGGSTAIKRTLFESLQIESKWKRGFSDDLILTEAVKKAGYIIQFVPSCISESPVETQLTKFLRWGTGQFTWVRWYNPVIWFSSFVGMVLLQLIILLGILLLFFGYLTPGLLMVSPLFFEMVYGGVGFFVLRALMRYPKERFGSPVPYILLMPLINVLFAYHMIHSGVKRRIKWAGKYYTKRDALRQR